MNNRKKGVNSGKASSTKAKPARNAKAKLSGSDKANLAQLEVTIGNGLASFLDVGLALMQINEKQLYKASFKTFAEYCVQRWGITDRYAYRQIQAAKCMLALRDEFTSKDAVLPTNEAQIRPIYEGYEKPTEWIEAWKRVVKSTHGKKITAEAVDKVVNKMLGKGAHKNTRKSKKAVATPDKMLSKILMSIDGALQRKRGANGRYFRKVLEEIRQLIQNRIETAKTS